MSRIMALDIGMRRTGIAVTDPEQIIATGLKTISTSALKIFLDDFLKTEQVEEVVVGWPKNLDNTDSDVTSFIKNTVVNLQTYFHTLKWHWEDERFTSKMAYKTMGMAGAGKSKMKDKSTVDMLSAVLILQSYLERKRMTS